MKKPKVTELSAAEALHGNTTSAKVGRDGKPYDPLSELSDTTARKVRAVMGGVEYGQMQSIDDLNKSVKDYSVQAMNKWEKKAYVFDHSIDFILFSRKLLPCLFCIVLYFQI